MKQALVTGATGGIGRAIALALRDRGYAVTALGRDRAALAALARESNICPVAVDMADRPALRAAVAHLAPDVLVNNAGMMPPLVPFFELDEAEIDRTVEINVTSTLALTRLVLPAMVGRGSGHIFFTGSTAGHAPFAQLAVYAATKSAIAGFAQSLRLDLAAHGLRVTEIVAGRVETGLYRGRLPDDVRAAMYKDHAAVQPEDIAQMVLAVLDMPPHVDVARFDILPTRQGTPPGSMAKETK
jgi:3-hydroxy acid dehydrogenase/malonic semialdehyde reductase